MAFWSDTTLDPKRQFKFKITFDFLKGINTTESTYLAQSADRPVYKISDAGKVYYLDKEFKFPGKVTWDPVKITFVDTAGGSTNVSKRVYDYLIGTNPGAGHVLAPNAGPAVGADNLRTISKARAVGSTGDVHIDVLDSEGRAVDQWTLKNAFVTTATLNGLDYNAEGILTAQFSFTYDWAEFFSPQY